MLFLPAFSFTILPSCTPVLQSVINMLFAEFADRPHDVCHLGEPGGIDAGCRGESNANGIFASAADLFAHFVEVFLLRSQNRGTWGKGERGEGSVRVKG